MQRNAPSGFPPLWTLDTMAKIPATKPRPTAINTFPIAANEALESPDTAAAWGATCAATKKAIISRMIGIATETIRLFIVYPFLKASYENDAGSTKTVERFCAYWHMRSRAI